MFWPTAAPAREPTPRYDRAGAGRGGLCGRTRDCRADPGRRAANGRRRRLLGPARLQRLRLHAGRARPASAPAGAGRAARRSRFWDQVVRSPWRKPVPGRGSCSWPASPMAKRLSTTGRTWTDATVALGLSPALPAARQAPGPRRRRSPYEGGPTMSTIHASDQFTALPDDQALAATVVALEEHGFSVEVVDGLDAARKAVLARIPEGSSVMTDTSVTLQETGIADAINDGGPYESARNKMFALDFATQVQEMKAIGGQPDYALGSVHAVTRDGTLVIAWASGSQLASYAWGAANVIFVVGAQKLVPTVEAAHERIYQHSLKLEDARAYAAYGQHSSVGKILEIHQELPGRIHVVLIRQPVGF